VSGVLLPYYNLINTESHCLIVTYKQLLEELKNLTEEQLNCNVRVLTVDEYAVEDEDRYSYDDEYIFNRDTPKPYFL